MEITKATDWTPLVFYIMEFIRVFAGIFVGNSNCIYGPLNSPHCKNILPLDRNTGILILYIDRMFSI
jgi:hypothetical protein